MHTSERQTLLHSNADSFFNDFLIKLEAGTFSCDVGPVVSESIHSNSNSVHNDFDGTYENFIMIHFYN